MSHTYQTLIIDYPNESKRVKESLEALKEVRKATATDDEVTISYQGTALMEVVDALSNVVLEDLFLEVAHIHMKTVGYTDEFIEGYFSEDLLNQIRTLPWKNTLEDKLLNEIDNAPEHTLQLEVFYHFSTHEEREWIKGFIELCDAEIQTQVIGLSLDPFVESGMHHEPTLSVEVAMADGLGLAVKGEDAWDVPYIKDTFEGIFQQSVYTVDGEAHEEFTDFTLLALLALLYGVESYYVDNKELQTKLEHLLRHYNINTKVVLNDSTGS